MLSGTLAGFNVVDVKVTLYDGSYHEVDSSEMAFKIAGSMAFKDAMKKASPVLMEPIMKIAVIVPEEYMGDVIGDINSRRGLVQGMETRTGATQVNAFIPLSNMFGYATDLRSKTQGRGQYAMEPSHYAEVPNLFLKRLLAIGQKIMLKALEMNRNFGRIIKNSIFKLKYYCFVNKGGKPMARQNLKEQSPMLILVQLVTLTMVRQLLQLQSQKHSQLQEEQHLLITQTSIRLQRERARNYN